MISQPRAAGARTARREGEERRRRNGRRRQRADTSRASGRETLAGLADAVREGLPRNLEDRVLQQQQ